MNSARISWTRLSAAQAKISVYNSIPCFRSGNAVVNPQRHIQIRTMAAEATVKRAEDLINFLDASPTPFHAVNSAKQRLEKAGFKQVKERDPWHSTLVPGGKYYVTRNGSAIVAFAIGAKWKPGNPVAIVGSHTDSCVLRVKPISKRTADGFLQVGVECYGGGMWHTWFDRDLGIAGRLMVKGTDGTIAMKLVRINRPVCRIPNLAVHFGGSTPFEFNKEAQLLPIIGLVSAELNRTGKTADETKKAEIEAQNAAPFEPLKTPIQRHHPHLINLLAEEVGSQPEAIVDFELILFDTQAACIGGLNNEFIHSARLDDLALTYCAVESLIQSVSSSSALDDEHIIRMIAAFDHEEVGSTSQQGADSNMLPAVLRRLSCISASTTSTESEHSYDKMSTGSASEESGNSTAFEQTLATSLLVSADMAHSVNPNYGAKYEAEHRPEMNAGTVIKIHANVRYATNSPGIVLLQECARRSKPGSFQVPGSKVTKEGVPLQLFVVRNDCPCGSTIGPMLSAKLGMRTIDVGNAQLAMHSIRETCGAYDIEYSVNLFDSFFQHYGDLEPKILVD